MDDFKLLTPEEIETLFGSASTFCLERDLMLNALELTKRINKSSLATIKKNIKEGALKINGKVVTDIDEPLNLDEIIINGKYSLICWGKRKFSLVKWV